MKLVKKNSHRGYRKRKPTQETYGEYVRGKLSHVWGDVFDDVDVEKVTSRESKVMVTCPIHGAYETSVRTLIEGNVAGCAGCMNEILREERKMDESLFFERINSMLNDKYDTGFIDFSRVDNNRTKFVLFCNDCLSFFTINFSNLSAGKRCKRCRFSHTSIRLRTGLDELYDSCVKVHGNRFEYDFSGYKNGSSKIRVKCPIHGWFSCSSDNHIRNNSGCPMCARVNRTYDHLIRCSDKEKRDLCYFYYVVISMPNGNKYHKVGITKREVKQRFVRDVREGASVDIITLVKNRYDFCCILESKFLYDIDNSHARWNSINQRAKVDLSGGGWTEVFDPLKYDVISRMKEMMEISCLSVYGDTLLYDRGIIPSFPCNDYSMGTAV